MTETNSRELLKYMAYSKPTIWAYICYGLAVVWVCPLKVHVLELVLVQPYERAQSSRRSLEANIVIN